MEAKIKEVLSSTPETENVRIKFQDHILEKHSDDRKLKVCNSVWELARRLLTFDVKKTNKQKTEGKKNETVNSNENHTTTRKV